jgi:hypothetical protein
MWPLIFPPRKRPKSSSASLSRNWLTRRWSFSTPYVRIGLKRQQAKVFMIPKQGRALNLRLLTNKKAPLSDFRQASFFPSPVRRQAGGTVCCVAGGLAVMAGKIRGQPSLPANHTSLPSPSLYGIFFSGRGLRGTLFYCPKICTAMGGEKLWDVVLLKGPHHAPL